YLLVRRIIEPRWAALAVLAVVAVPGFVVNTTTFMTDIPAFATTYLCLALGAVAIGRPGIDARLLAASLAVGCVAVSIRESTLAAPVAVVTVAAFADPARLRRYVAILVGLVAYILVIHALVSLLPGQAEARYDPHGGLDRLRGGFSTLAVCLVPAIVVAIPRWRSRWRLVDILPGLAV